MSYCNTFQLIKCFKCFPFTVVSPQHSSLHKKYNTPIVFWSFRPTLHAYQKCSLSVLFVTKCVMLHTQLIISFSHCLSAFPNQLLKFKVWPSIRLAWVYSDMLVWSIRACVGSFFNEWGHSLIWFYTILQPSWVDYSTVWPLNLLLLPKMILLTFLPTFTLTLLTLLLSASASYILPLSPHHPPTHICSFFSRATQLVGLPGGSACVWGA